MAITANVPCVNMRKKHTMDVLFNTLAWLHVLQIWSLPNFGEIGLYAAHRCATFTVLTQYRQNCHVFSQITPMASEQVANMLFSFVSISLYSQPKAIIRLQKHRIPTLYLSLEGSSLDMEISFASAQISHKVTQYKFQIFIQLTECNKKRVTNLRF